MPIPDLAPLVAKRNAEDARRARWLIALGVPFGRVAMFFLATALGSGFHGMPLMADVTDPENLAALERAQRTGCANVVLAGPRHVRKGIELLLLIRRRRGAPPGASAFAAWLAEAGPTPEAALHAFLNERPELAPGFLLASELGLLSVRRTEQGRVYSRRPRIESDTPGPR